MKEPTQDEPDEAPLDPAVERVRRRLVRFMGINLGILFLALMVVVAALVYRGTRSEGEGMGGTAEASLLIPAGARILSQSLAEGEIALHLSLTGGVEAVQVHDARTGRLLARLAVVNEP